jgi:hypothetical protein
MEERVAGGRERRRSMVQGFKARTLDSGNSLPNGWGEGQGEGTIQVIMAIKRIWYESLGTKK